MLFASAEVMRLMRSDDISTIDKFFAYNIDFFGMCRLVDAEI